VNATTAEYFTNSTISLNPDKFGFYQVGAIKTYRKLEALELHARTGIFPNWNFNSEVFDIIDWFNEPVDTLWTLYQARARQIRNTYDYCVLFYSGGSDSDNILQAWLSAGCKIDEIATIKIISARSVPKNFDWSVEPYLVVDPRIRLLQSQGHKFKYREIDSVESTLSYLKASNMSDYFYQNNFNPSPNVPMKSEFRKIISEYSDIIASGKKLCFVWGSDKPQIHYNAESDQWFFNFVDIIDNCVSPTVQENYYQGWFDELFYWTPDLPAIPIKQSHVIKNFCQNNHNADYYQSSPTPYGYNKVVKGYLKEKIVKILIYPKWDPNTVVARKPSFGIKESQLPFSDKDSWLLGQHNEFLISYKKQLKSYLNFLKTHNRYQWLNSSGYYNPAAGSIQRHRFF
jgi:hypothetical protein